jgi:hypothetical protein
VKNSINTESWAMENLVTMGNRVMQDSRGHEIGKRKRCRSKQKASSTVVPKGYYQDTKMEITKDVSKRVGQEKRRGRAGLLV